MPSLAGSMRRHALLALLTGALAQASLAADAASMADVLTRCKTLLPTETTTLVTMSASDVPSDVRAALSKKGAKWESMTDAGRVGVLWSYGYVFYGSLDSSAKYSQVAKVYTECSSAGGSDTEVSGGVAMSDIALSSAKYTSAGCTASTCGSGISLGTNDQCVGSDLKSKIMCVIDTPMAGDFATSSGAIWSAVESSNQLPYPQAFAHNITVSTGKGSRDSMSVYAIHMRSGASSTACQSSGDIVIPCLRRSDISPSSKFCRPTVPEPIVQTFLAATEANASSGSNTTVIIVVVVVVVLLLVAGVGLFMWWKRGKNRANSPPVNTKMNDLPTTSTTSYNPPPLHPSMSSGHDSVPSDGTTKYPDWGSSSLTSSQMLDSFPSMNGCKTIKEYCAESTILNDFVHDQDILTRKIAHEEVTFLRLLSKGAFGEVWLGQLETRHVAIKKLLPEKSHSTSSLEQFAGEIRLMCILRHRNIVTFLGVSWNNHLQSLCALAEYMESGDLSDVFARSKGKLSWSKEKISIAMDIADGLVYLHTLQPKVIHRDLKSKNVLLNKKYQAKLSDFGVSRKSNVNETLTSGVGTLLWTAPEIIEGKKYDEKADIYSFGVVLSEIDTCQGPFAHMKTDKGDNIPGMQLVQMVRLGQLRVSFSDDCPAAIRELAEACTQLDPDFRPTSMEAAFTLKSKIAPKLRNALQRIDSA